MSYYTTKVCMTDSTAINQIINIKQIAELFSTLNYFLETVTEK